MEAMATVGPRFYVACEPDLRRTTLTTAALSTTSTTTSSTTTDAATIAGLLSLQTTTASSPTAPTVGATSSAPTTTTSSIAPASTSTTTTTAPHGTVVTVNSVAGLTAALKTATAGETIALAAGNYSGVALNGVHFNQAVTITSADPTHEAVLVGLKVTGSSGLAFNDIGMTTVGSTDPYYAFRVSSSQNISFNDVNAYGASTVAPGSQLTGFYISGSNGVSITNSTIHDMNGGIDASQDQNLTFSNNSFYALSKGGIGISADNNVVASGNTFTNFTVANGTHSDAIQVFTAGTTVGSSNVTITDNTMTRGTGNAFQGVFVKDETGVTPYSNLTITNNTVIGGMWNSIYVNAAVTGVLNVSNNMAASWAGIDVSSAAAGATTYPTANFLGSVELTGNFSGAQLTEVGNVAQGYITNQISGVAPTGNTMIGAIAPVTNLAQLQTMVTAVAAQSAVVEHGTVAGNVLTGATGVLALFTGADYVAAGFGGFAQGAVSADAVEWKRGAFLASLGHMVHDMPHVPFAVGKVRYPGEPVAMVIAETREGARDAAEAVHVTYDILPAVTDALEALAPGAPHL